MSKYVKIVVREGKSATISSPYEARETIKYAVPYYLRTWNGEYKRWEIDQSYVLDLADALQSAGFTVVMEDEKGNPWTGPKKRPAASAGGGGKPFSWLPLAFKDAKTDDRETLRKALLRVWHPDLGHDPSISKQINEAANAVGQRVRG